MVEKTAGFVVMVNGWLVPVPAKIRMCPDETSATRRFVAVVRRRMDRGDLLVSAPAR